MYPKLTAAFKSQKSSKDEVANLGKSAGTITGTMFSRKAGDRIDYGGLLADWREMDLNADSAFQAIKEEVAPEEIDGLEAYRVAMKKLVVRGETLVNALREAYEARTQLLLLKAEMKARTATLDEIRTLHATVIKDKKHEAVAFMSVKHRLTTELTQQRRVVFNMLHRGVLALVYQSNNVKLQKYDFALLSPNLSATDIAKHWANFKKATVEYGQTQSDDLGVNTSEAFPLGWHDLLVNDHETPFQIRPTLKKLSDLHQMRIRTIHAEFVGLERHDHTTTGIDNIQYTIWLGPLMLDRASPRDKAKSFEATTVQYYMDRRALRKKGKKNELLDEKSQFAKRSLCCSGKVSFKKAYVEEEGWNLEKVTDIILHINYETLSFDE